VLKKNSVDRFKKTHKKGKSRENAIMACLGFL
jgi:stalled ribosome alternative rescue factor ArfA